MSARRAIALKPAADDNTPRLQRGRFTVTANGLAATGPATLDDWGALGPELAIWGIGREFIVGDWLNYGEDRYGEEAAQFASGHGGKRVVRNVIRHALP